MTAHEALCHSRDSSMDHLSDCPSISKSCVEGGRNVRTFKDKEVMLMSKLKHLLSSFKGGSHARRITSVLGEGHDNRLEREAGELTGTV